MVASVIDPKHANTIVRHLSQVAPLEGFHHVRRVQKKFLEGGLRICKYAATSKEEWEEQCKLWPTSYHPPTNNIDGITGFNEEDSRFVFNSMQVAVELAKSGHSWL
ncbi:Cytidine/deoxycytidylate deaminase family protein [Quillaja saponaria]|uniref:Cytidine/deoxycytidylate deaminase family protein n=1 Tax=Quillaja saponaria TaxID=32244 RepID=A0AAD7QCK5_QUISA|nr:Cytidine/deoxycytidylate deaminase family protein [Quillaja saponaria]